MANVPDIKTPDLETKILGDIKLNITEQGGVRKIGPPPGWKGNKPSKESEVFIAKLPNNLYEAELITLCEQFGKIYELRLMMNVKNTAETETKGYAFVRYIKTEDATKAIEHLNGFEIRKGVHVSVCKSIDNRRIFISGIPEDKKEEEIMEEISKWTDGACQITGIDFFPNDYFVAYDSPEAALLAKSSLRGKKLFDVKVRVKIAHPEIEFNDDGTVQEVAPDTSSSNSALAGTSSSDQTPVVVVDAAGNPMICSLCRYRKQENDQEKFVKTKCGHAYCITCMNYKFSKNNPEKPRLCNVCGRKIFSTAKSVALTGHVLVDD